MTCREEPIFQTFSSRTLPMAKLGTKTVVFGASSSDPKEFMFMDENGVVDEMDYYLNYLSLEYDSLGYKALLVSTMDVSVNRYISVCLWLADYSITPSYNRYIISSLHLVVHISLFLSSDMIADRRKRVESGVEDTFGSEKSQ